MNPFKLIVALSLTLTMFSPLMAQNHYWSNGKQIQLSVDSLKISILVDGNVPTDIINLDKPNLSQVEIREDINQVIFHFSEPPVDSFSVGSWPEVDVLNFNAEAYVRQYENGADVEFLNQLVFKFKYPQSTFPEWLDELIAQFEATVVRQRHGNTVLGVPTVDDAFA